MKYTLCAHSIYEEKPIGVLDDLSSKEFRKLIKLFNISFDDGYRNIYTIGKKVFKNCSNKIYIFINPSFIEKKSTIWWFEIYDYIKDKDFIRFNYRGKEFFRETITSNQKINAYKELSHIFKNLDRKHQEELLTNLKKSISRNNYEHLFMTWEMIRELSLIDNVMIGSHSNIHNNLKLFKTEDLINDLMSSKIKIEEKINLKVSYLAIPYGDKSSFSEREITLAKNIGYKKIFTTDPNIFKRNKDIKDCLIIDRLCTRAKCNNRVIIFARLFIKSIINVYSGFNNHNL